MGAALRQRPITAYAELNKAFFQPHMGRPENDTNNIIDIFDKYDIYINLSCHSTLP
jgi:hypothetical protein